MVAPAVVLGAKVVVGKIAEQVAIQAAAELLLRRILPGRGGGGAAPAAPADNPIADLEVSALMQQVAQIANGGGGGSAAPKKKVNRYNRLLKAEMKKLRGSKMDGKNRFKVAAKRASKAFKASKTKAKRSK